MTSLASVKSKAKTSYELALALADPHDKTMWIPASAVEAFEKELRAELKESYKAHKMFLVRNDYIGEAVRAIFSASIGTIERVLGDSTFDSKQTKDGIEC